MQVKLYTDYSVVRYGFDIVRIEAKKGPDILARFPGQWYEPHTEVRAPNTNTLQHAGLHYNWHRYYDPNIGRYITPDPIGLAGGLNVYAYADNDPVNRTDSTGLYTSIHTREGMLAWSLAMGSLATAATQTAQVTGATCAFVGTAAFLGSNGPDLGKQLLEAYQSVKDVLKNYFRQRVFCDTVDIDGDGIPDTYQCGGVLSVKDPINIALGMRS